MVAWKFTFLFDYLGHAGWTETFYKDAEGGTGGAGVKPIARLWATNRAKVLSAACTILSVRMTPTNAPRQTILFGLNQTGSLGQGIVFDNIQPDVVNLAQLTTFTSTSGIKRQYLIRGLDDRDVVNGKITYEQNGPNLMKRYLDFLVSQNWAMRDYTVGAVKEVTSVDGATGVVSLAAAPVVAEGDLVVLHSRTAGNGLKIRWQGKVKLIGAASVKLKSYRFGDGNGGDLAKITATYPTFTDHVEPVPNWSRTRQTGRPFNLPRGRAPKRT